jgi:hypothetical protein
MWARVCSRGSSTKGTSSPGAREIAAVCRRGLTASGPVSSYVRPACPSSQCRCGYGGDGGDIGFAARDAIDLIRDRGITTACVVPAMLRMMLGEPGR